jgi:hypothetical protein
MKAALIPTSLLCPTIDAERKFSGTSSRRGRGASGRRGRGTSGRRGRGTRRRTGRRTGSRRGRGTGRRRSALVGVAARPAQAVVVMNKAVGRRDRVADLGRQFAGELVPVQPPTKRSTSHYSAAAYAHRDRVGVKSPRIWDAARTHSRDS